MSYLVAQRTREVGIRIALGATRRQIVRLIVGRGALLVGCGIVAGAAASIALQGVMSSLALSRNDRRRRDDRGDRCSRRDRRPGLLRSRPARGASRSAGRVESRVTIVLTHEQSSRSSCGPTVLTSIHGNDDERQVIILFGVADPFPHRLGESRRNLICPATHRRTAALPSASLHRIPRRLNSAPRSRRR